MAEQATYKCDVCGMELERKSLKTNRGMMEFPCHAGTEDVHGVIECQKEHIVKLKARIVEREEEFQREKTERIYYQGIVYHVCNDLDALLAGRRKIMCGSAEWPDTGVQDGMAAVKARIVRLRG